MSIGATTLASTPMQAPAHVCGRDAQGSGGPQGWQRIGSRSKSPTVTLFPLRACSLLGRYLWASRRWKTSLLFSKRLLSRARSNAILRAHPAANRNFGYRDQLLDAASGVEAQIAEGWRRRGNRDMIRFFRYAAGSLEEAQVRMLDGVTRGYFDRAICNDALRHYKRCSSAIAGFIRRTDGPTDHRTHGPCFGRSYLATAAELFRLCEAARSIPVFGSRLMATHSPSPPKRTSLGSTSRYP